MVNFLMIFHKILSYWWILIKFDNIKPNFCGNTSQIWSTLIKLYEIISGQFVVKFYLFQKYTSVGKTIEVLYLYSKLKIQ